MKDATVEILNELSLRGYRVTLPRKNIIGILTKLSQPISIQELSARVSDTDEASVYRTMSMLKEEGFIEEITIPKEAPRYALAHGHHHHVICSSCGWTEHAPCTQQGFATALPSSFESIASHEVTLYGLCKKCA